MAKIELTVNGTKHAREVEDRALLVDVMRDQLNLTGTHIGCDTSQCGCCTVHIEGRAVKSCTMLAAQANGANVVTIEGLADGDKLTVGRVTFVVQSETNADGGSPKTTWTSN